MAWSVLYLTLFVLLVSSRILKLFRDLKTVDHLPGMRCLFSPLSIPGALLPHTSWNPGLNWTWHWRSFIYKQYQSDTISVVSWLSGRPYIFTNSIEVSRQVMTNSHFFKEPSTTRGVALWGENIISTDHETYKRHRRIVGPAFSSNIFPLIWEETYKTYKEMMADEGWTEKTIVLTHCINDQVQKLALILISRCAFGISFPWTASSPSKDELNVESALSNVSRTILLRTVAPRWLYTLPVKALAEVEKAHHFLENFMKSLVTSHKSETTPQAGKGDLFTRLVKANEMQGKFVLDDRELVGNVFAFLFAGHETTARTIAATLALLALHPEEQDIAVEEIRSVLVSGRDPVLSDTPALSKVQACFVEGARMYPPAYIMMRDVEETVKVTTPTDKGDKTFVVGPGTCIVTDVIGMCYNPRHFKDPEVYRPSRWYGAQDSDMVFFGLGPRACLGRKFALTEALCFLTVFLRDWAVSPLLRDGETVNEWESRVLKQGELLLTFGVGDVSIKLTKRVWCVTSLSMACECSSGMLTGSLYPFRIKNSTMEYQMMESTEA